MNKRSIHTFVMRFLEAYGCTVVEKTPASVTVKLSPEADREMTGRPYYWSFVERTGAPAETMTYTLVFDPEAHEAEAQAGKAAGGRNGRSGAGGLGAAGQAVGGAGAQGEAGAGPVAGMQGVGAVGTELVAGTQGVGAVVQGGAAVGQGHRAINAEGRSEVDGAAAADGQDAVDGSGGGNANGQTGPGKGGADATSVRVWGAGVQASGAGDGADAAQADSGRQGTRQSAWDGAVQAGADRRPAAGANGGGGAGQTGQGIGGADAGAAGMGIESPGEPGATQRYGAGAATAAANGTGIAQQSGGAAYGTGPAAGGAESILGRYFGFVPTTVATRVPRDEVTLGSRRLEQLFDIVLQKGRFVRLFEEPFLFPSTPRTTLVYDTWFCVNYKVELACDRKRSEIHSLAMQLNTGEIREHFHKQLLTKSLSPKLPANLHILPDLIPLHKAMNELEAHLERIVARYDHSWAAEANEQHLFELRRVEAYYDGLLLGAEPEQRPQIEAQCRNRLQEIDWQYKPRIAVSVINCGMFHLSAARAPRN